MRCEPASASSTWRPMRSRSRATSVSCFCLSFASGPRSAKSHSSRGSSVAFHAWRGMGVRRLRSERGGESKESKLPRVVQARHARRGDARGRALG